eukprot:scaffold518676_cov55-Prasinocladus_malaysianus.AAC.1
MELIHPLDGGQSMPVVQPETRIGLLAAVAQAHGVVDPLDDAAVLRERNHIERAQIEVPLPARRVLDKQPAKECVHIITYNPFDDSPNSERCNSYYL